MFSGIRIGFPFITPSLLTDDVVNAIIDALHVGVVVPDAIHPSAAPSDVAAIADMLKSRANQPSRIDRFFQHKVRWMPVTYYMAVWSYVMMPLWLSDWIKDVLGGNGAVTESFRGRAQDAADVVTSEKM